MLYYILLTFYLKLAKLKSQYNLHNVSVHSICIYLSYLFVCLFVSMIKFAAFHSSCTILKLHNNLITENSKVLAYKARKVNLVQCYLLYELLHGDLVMLMFRTVLEQMSYKPRLCYDSC